MRPYHEDDDLVVFHGDCRELLGELEAACVVTSPPFNSGVDYDVHDDGMDSLAYEMLVSEASLLMSRAIEPASGRAWVSPSTAS